MYIYLELDGRSIALDEHPCGLDDLPFGPLAAFDIQKKNASSEALLKARRVPP